MILDTINKPVKRRNYMRISPCSLSHRRNCSMHGIRSGNLKSIFRSKWNVRIATCCQIISSQKVHKSALYGVWYEFQIGAACIEFANTKKEQGRNRLAYRTITCCVVMYLLLYIPRESIVTSKMTAQPQMDMKNGKSDTDL